MVKISVIIPVYNAEKYLAECLDSVLTQTFEDWEALCINDGSSDKSAQILSVYAQKDNRIKVITQENKGPPTTRNVGLKQAKGEYVCFLDADDMLHPEFLKILLENMEKYRVPVIGGNFEPFTKGYTFLPISEEISVKYYKYPLLKYLLRQMKYNAMVWGKLYHKSVFQNLCFDSDLYYGEDTHISIQILSKIDSIAFISTPLYAYRQSENSITRNPFRTKMIDDHILSSLKLNEFFKKKSLSLLVWYLLKKKTANRWFRWACVKPYKKDKENYQKIWECYIPIINNLIKEKKLNPFDLSLRYWLPFWLWRHRYFKILKLIMK